MKKIRAFRPQAERLDIRIVPGDLTLLPPSPVPLLTAPQNPAVVPVPLLTLPMAPDRDGTAPAPGPITGTVMAAITVGGETHYVVGDTNGVSVILPTTGIPSGEGTIMMIFPDGTTGGYDGTINANDASTRLHGVQSETDADGNSYMALPCNCTVPAIYPADLGVSA